MLPEWLKFKKYPHIGEPLTSKRDAGWVMEYVQDKDKVATHKFTPLLHKTISQRKFRPNKDASKNKFGKRIRSVQKKKVRPIFYASHIDSMLYSYYSFLLANAYEDYLKHSDFKDCPVAYRKIPIQKGKRGNKCNIEFAFETFQFVEKNKDRKLSMIVSDITSFFDNLDQRILHTQWKKVLNKFSLPEDHYNVYKSLINKRYVNENELYNRFKRELIVERGLENNIKGKKFTRKAVKRIFYLKKERVVAYCSKKDFFKKATDLIRVEKRCSLQHQRCRNNCVTKGIPQGTAMSATLANIYMIDFDQLVYTETKKRNAYYQRYSDDLIIICDQEDEKYFYDLIRSSILNLVSLEIHPEKTKKYRYEMVNNQFSGGFVLDTEEITTNKQLEYLGFEYDGEKVRVKTVGFSKFYRSMKRAIRRGIHFASKPENKNKDLFEERLYKRFSYKGAGRRLIWKKDPKSETGYSPSEEQYWGNYISYLEKANRVMRPINCDDTIKNQFSRFWPNFGKEMTKAKAKIGKRKKNNSKKYFHKRTKRIIN